MLQKTWKLLDDSGLSALTITVKIKYYDFILQTKRHTERSPINGLAVAEMVTQSLLREALSSQQDANRPVRLIGVSFSQLTEKRCRPIQLRLFD